MALVMLHTHTHTHTHARTPQPPTHTHIQHHQSCQPSRSGKNDVDEKPTCRMDAVSEHSTIKVDSPAMMRSDAPSLVKILSATDIVQDSAGTQHPT